MTLTSEDAPQWLKDEVLRKKWAELNNSRLRVWRPDEAPAWISAKRKREEWAQKKNAIEESDLTYLMPCICDKCGAEFVGIEWQDHILSNDREMRILGVHRSAAHSETDCVLCRSCNERLRRALQEFEAQWIKDGE